MIAKNVGAWQAVRLLKKFWGVRHLIKFFGLIYLQPGHCWMNIIYRLNYEEYFSYLNLLFVQDPRTDENGQHTTTNYKMVGISIFGHFYFSIYSCNFLLKIQKYWKWGATSKIFCCFLFKALYCLHFKASSGGKSFKEFIFSFIVWNFYTGRSADN